MAETKINASQTTITASDIGAARAATVLPTASVSEEGKIYQFVGTTTASYTNGYFYKCVSDGQNPATYSWERVDVQPTPVIPDPLPSQTGQSGKFLTTNGTAASWGTINALTNKAGSDTRSLSILGNSNSSYYYCVAIGYQTQTRANRTISIGCESLCGGRSGSILISTVWNNLKYPGESSVCVGSLTSGYASTNTMMVHIGNSNGDIKYGWGSVFIGNQNESVTLDAGSFYVGLMTSYSDYANSTFKLLSRDGTIPEARLADTTNAAQGMVLTLDSNLNAVWAAGGSGGGVSDVTVNGTSVVSGGVAAITCATIDDTSTSSQTETWSASKLNTTIGNIESLLAAI